MILLRRSLAVLLLLLGAWPAFAAREAGPLIRRSASDDPAVARVIVKYRADSALMRPLSAGAAAPRPLHAARLGARLGLVMTDRWVLGARTQSLSAEGIGAAELARRLAAQPDVEWAEPVGRKVINAVVPNDPYYADGQTTITPAVGQWYLRAPDVTVVSAINAVGAWALTIGSPTITVAVLDTGVRFDHPDFLRADLSSKLYAGYDFISRTGTSADGDGVDADASDPGDWNTSHECSGTASASSWHGTQTAGLVGAATDNAVGMASAGREVMVLPVRVLGKCGGWDDDIQAAMLWAAGLSSSPVANAHPARVINMSLGSSGACTAGYQAVFNQLTAAGVTVVVAAGNDEGLAVGTPANCSGAIAVGGLRHIGTKVGFSNVGPEVTLSAPGGNCVNLSGLCLYPILTTTNAGTTIPSTNTWSTSSNYSVGTSFSAPLVAGTVGLMLSIDPTLTPAQIRAKLQSTARPFPTTGAADASVVACHAPTAATQDECYCTTTTCGAGMLDAAAAVAAAVPAAVAPPTAAIMASSTTPQAGAGVTLDASASAAFGGRTIAAYQWTITAGAGLAAFSGPTNASTATLVTTDAGSVTVQVTVTDSAGITGTQTLTLTVQPAPVPTTPITAAPAPVASDSGGGGALSAEWLALLALATAALALRRRPS